MYPFFPLTLHWFCEMYSFPLFSQSCLWTKGKKRKAHFFDNWWNAPLPLKWWERNTTLFVLRKSFSSSLMVCTSHRIYQPTPLTSNPGVPSFSWIFLGWVYASSLSPPISLSLSRTDLSFTFRLTHPFHSLSLSLARSRSHTSISLFHSHTPETHHHFQIRCSLAFKHFKHSKKLSANEKIVVSAPFFGVGNEIASEILTMMCLCHIHTHTLSLSRDTYSHSNSVSRTTFSLSHPFSLALSLFRTLSLSIHI